MGVSHVHCRTVEHSSEPGIQIIGGYFIPIKGYSPLFWTRSVGNSPTCASCSWNSSARCARATSRRAKPRCRPSEARNSFARCVADASRRSNGFRHCAEVLDLEFYVGPRRRSSSMDPHRLEHALEAADRGLGLSGRTMDYPSKARFVSAIYDLIGEDSTPAKNAERVLHLIKTMSDNRDAGARLGQRRSRPKSPGRGM